MGGLGGRKNTGRAVHAKGIVAEVRSRQAQAPRGARHLEGTFMPVKDAQSIAMAPIFADGSLNPCPERSIFGFDVYGLAT
jgi:hypothetical protein